MAERPKTAAQIAEDRGLLQIEQLLYKANTLLNRVGDIRQDIDDIGMRLNWIIGTVGAINNQNLATTITELRNVKNLVNDLRAKTLQVGDILSADSTNI